MFKQIIISQIKPNSNQRETPRTIIIKQLHKKSIICAISNFISDADFCCGMDTPEKAKNVSGWLPGRAQNRGAF